MNYSINVEKCYEPDVLVCGMGPAGLTAAIAAARTGAKVMGIEKCGYSGGNITNGMVNTCCGIADQLTGEMAVGGITLEICTKTDAVELPLKDNKLFTAVGPYEHIYNSEGIPVYFDIELFKYLTQKYIEKKIDIETRNNFGFTALHLTAVLNNFKAAKLLIEKGADIEARDIIHLTESNLSIDDDYFVYSAQHKVDNNGYITSLELRG